MMFAFEIKDVTAKFEVINVHGVERISEPYEFELEILSSDSSLTSYIGQKASYRLQIGRTTTSRHGILNQITVVDADDSKVRYKVSLVPTIARLELKSDSRIFQEMTVEDILASVLQEHGIDDFQFVLSNMHPIKDYIVQYRETDLDFLQRIIEEEGLFYYFEHNDDRHTLIIADNATAYKPIPGRSQTLRYDPAAVETERVAEFSLSSLAATEAVRLREYNHETPTANLDVSKRVPGAATSIYEVYDYPGGYKRRTDGQRRAGWRFDAERLDTLSASAVTNSPRLAPGFTFKLTGHQYPAANQTYVVAELVHNGQQNPASTSLLGYQNSIVCVSAKMPFRLTDRYPSLTMQGPQTATVVGPAGEEIYVDEQGRVRVQFHWDRVGQFDENSSAWIRVAQASAGNGWGHLVIPRIGSEVLVDFVNGDPHQPVVIGALYNGANQVPYALPENKNVTVLKTNSTPNGRGFNELQFDDTTDNEQVLLRAQKDLSLVVQNDIHESVAGNSNVSIDRDANLTIGRQRSETVGTNLTVTVGSTMTEDVGGNHALSVGGNQTSTIGNGHTQSIGKAYACTVGGKSTLAAKSIVLDALDTITFKTGDSKIVMKKNGNIKIEGKKIDIKSSGLLTLKGSNLS